MRGINEGDVKGDLLERLTTAVRQLCQTMEEARPGCFNYDSVSLRGAIEISCYWEIVTDPGRRAVFDQASAGKPGLAAEIPCSRIRLGWLGRVIAFVKGCVLLGYHGVFRPIARRRSRQALPSVEFVFCVIHPRFIQFFLPIINKLGRHRCGLLCDGDPQTALEAARHGLTVCAPGYARLRIRGIGRPPSSVFQRYSVAVVQFLKAVGTLRRYKPAVAVFAEGVSFQEAVIARAARYLGISSVRVQHGRAGVLNPAYYDMPFDKVLMWGQGFIERLQRTSPACRYVVTGTPLLDYAMDGSADTTLPFQSGPQPVVAIISQPEGPNISRRDYETVVNVADGVLLSEPNVNILVRMHPLDRADDFVALEERWKARVKVTRAQEYPLAAILAISTLVVGLYSTVLSEAVAFGVLPVVIRLSDKHRVFPSPEESAAAVLATSSDEAVRAISELARDGAKRASYSANMAEFARHYFGPLDGRAVERIALHIETPEK